MTTIAASADQAYRAGARRRARRTALENAVDGALAVGGVFFANAAFGLGLGMPEGVGGIALGLGLLCAGMAWLARHGRPVRPVRRTVASVARRPVPARPIVARRQVVLGFESVRRAA